MLVKEDLRLLYKKIRVNFLVLKLEVKLLIQ